MNHNVWIRKTLSMCLAIFVTTTYSMVALAGSDRIAGEIIVSGNTGGQSSLVKVNGESVQTGRSIFSASTIVTSENATAIINLGKIGKIEFAPNTTLALSFSENGISGELLDGNVTVLNAAQIVNITTIDGNLVKLNSGESASATSGKAQTTGKSVGATGWLLGIVLGGAIAAIVIAANTDNNRIALGNGVTIVSTVR